MGAAGMEVVFRLGASEPVNEFDRRPCEHPSSLFIDDGSLESASASFYNTLRRFL
jgi:hypothetical protein